jgi:hypothetical protein
MFCGDTKIIKINIFIKKGHLSAQNFKNKENKYNLTLSIEM